MGTETSTSPDAQMFSCPSHQLFRVRYVFEEVNQKDDVKLATWVFAACVRLVEAQALRK